MRYRRFGRTELQMPVFSCGGMRYQHSWNDVKPEDVPAANQENLEKTILRSLELGINHIETARGYGSSEMQLGRILPGLPREKMIIQTKVAPSASVDDFLKTFDKSMDYLGLDYVDLFSLHGINNAEVLNWSVREGGCLDAAERLRAEGRVRHIGFSTHASCTDIVAAIETGRFDYVNLHWYFVNNFNWPAVEAATRHDMGVFIISPNDKGGKLYEPPEKLSRLCEPLSPMIFNDLYCLARTEVHTLSLGASRPSDFDEHVKALEFYDRAEEVSAPIAARLRGEMESVLGTDWARSWWKGLPEHEVTPGNMNLPEILRLWNHAKALDLVEFARMRYNLLGEGGHWFPGLKVQEEAMGKLPPLLAGHAFAEKIPEILNEAHEWLNGEQKKRLSESE